MYHVSLEDIMPHVKSNCGAQIDARVWFDDKVEKDTCDEHKLLIGRQKYLYYGISYTHREREEERERQCVLYSYEIVNTIH